MIPDPARKGETFAQWCAVLRRYGYKLQFKELRACDYGTPPIRKRLYLIARNDNLPIVGPKKTHGRPGSADVISGKLAAWPVAADIIDFSLPCPSIFETSEEIYAKYGIRAKRPLVENTMARIGKGTWRYVIEAAAKGEAFIIPITHSGDTRSHPVSEGIRTITTAKRGEHALVTPFVTKFRQNSIGHPVTEPTHTITAHSSETRPGGAAPIGVVAPVLMSYYGGEGGADRSAPGDRPIGTDTTGPRHALVAPFLVPRYGERLGQEPRTRSVEEAMPTPVPTGNEASVVGVLLDRQYGRSAADGAGEPVATDSGTGKTAVVAAFLAQHNTGVVARDAREPVSTTLAGTGHQAVVQVSAGQINLKGTDRRGAAITDPVHSLCANGNHAGEVRAFLVKYFSAATHGQSLRDPLHTDTAKPRFGLVMIYGELYEIVDIGMRMLTVRERFRANGFPDTYIIDVEVNGKPITAEQQGRCCGNAVCPPMARALVLANLGQVPAETMEEIAA
jgi:DNA (cytosine-5)-methyltransferase 1